MISLPGIDVLIAFTAASLILIFTPGANMALFLGETLRGGRKRGFAAMLGVATGLLVHTMLAALGLSALLATSDAAFMVIRSPASRICCGSPGTRCAMARHSRSRQDGDPACCYERERPFWCT